MSSVVAVAGGSGGLGKAIVEAILGQGKQEVVILSRETGATSNVSFQTDENSARVVQVDYSDVSALQKVLQENGIDTVISTLNTMGDPTPELNLIEAADKSSVTKRLIPSVWGIPYTDEVVKTFPLGGIKQAVVSAVSRTSLEYSVWYIGYFTDYFVAPKIKSYMKIFNIVFDIQNDFAAIPGSGDVPVTFTYTFDVAQFVAASLALSKWQPETFLAGDKLTLNEMLAIAEEAKGTKFKVVYDSMEDLKVGKITELPSHAPMYPYFPKEQLQGFLASLGVLFASGFFDLKPARTINDDFTAIKPRSVRDLLTEAWKQG
ncbi:NAD(P)-binding protein [Tothia fuscella]|uniref:NAD(P)-binding protein n=1 Tax=Tothia fuscella TaxID=1048955 RepID=A0A9P4P549_9PEZI|nr:NAD(P)-binding protein [Tothia fuscella]